MSLDFNAFGSSALGAFMDSGFNARKRLTTGGHVVMPKSVASNYRPIYYGCTGYPFATFLGLCSSSSAVQQFEFIGSSGPTSWRVTAGGLPPGLGLYDPIPSDNLVSIIGTSGASGDFHFTLTASDDEFENEQEFMIRVRTSLKWDNVDLEPDIASGDYTSNGVLILSGAYNWLFPTSIATMSFIGNACPTGPGGPPLGPYTGPGTIRISENFDEAGPYTLSFEHDGGGPLWVKASGGVVGDYTSLGDPPFPAEIVNI